MTAEELGSGQYVVADPLPAGFEIENPDLGSADRRGRSRAGCQRRHADPCRSAHRPVCRRVPLRREARRLLDRLSGARHLAGHVRPARRDGRGHVPARNCAPIPTPARIEVQTSRAQSTPSRGDIDRQSARIASTPVTPGGRRRSWLVAGARASAGSAMAASRARRDRRRPAADPRPRDAPGLDWRWSIATGNCSAPSPPPMAAGACRSPSRTSTGASSTC